MTPRHDGAPEDGGKARPDASASKLPRFDPDAIRAHVELRHMLAEDAKVDGVLTLTTIEPNLNGGKDAIHTLQFEIGDIETEIKTILSYEGRTNINLYAPWCIFRSDLQRGRKGGESEVVRVLAFVGDMDRDTGKAGVMPIEAPYVIETSPGNSQHVLLLARALPPDEAKPIAMAFGDAVHCDARSKDVSGIWRIPGTHNWPNRKKLARGRPGEPQPVKVATPWAGDLVEPERLWEAIAAHSKPNGGAKANGKQNGHNDGGGNWQLGFMALPPMLQKAIKSPPLPDEDRSATAASVIISLVRLGWNDAQIAAVIRAHPKGVGQRYAEGSNLEADIARLRQKFESDGSLPELSLDDDPVTVAKKLAGLFAERRDILLNGYTPVRVVCEAGQEPRAVELTPEAVRVYAHDICRVVKTNKAGIKVETTLRPDIAKLYLHGLEGEWGLRPLRGISTSPLLATDGSIRSASGYDEAAGLWCHDIRAVSVPEHPNKEDAEKALLLLRQTFSTFPFGDAVMVHDAARKVDVVDLDHPPGLDESTHLVALMTAVTRASLPLAPAFLYTSSLFSGAGTGKGLMVKSACVIGTGARPSAMTAGHGVEELDKRLVAAAIEARPAIYLDNFNEETLESDTLASLLTEDPARVRVLGQSKTVPLNTRAFVGITGNAVQIAEDMARRILPITLDARMENPEQRPFEPGFLPSIFARRPELLSACLTIWRWAVQQGEKLPRRRPIGSYELWARWCRDPLVELGCRDPIERIANIKAADPRRRQLMEVFDLWWEHHQDQQVTAADLHTAVKEAIDVDAKRGNDGELYFNRQRIAGFLKSHAETRVGGFHLRQESTINARRHRVTAYRLQEAR
jgi:hypothetical protein